jgi:CDP-glucose 4,6-dehydratase
MESMVNAASSDLSRYYAGKRVLITGHTGFKGSWLALSLHRLGASVSGYALDPPTQPCLFEAARVKSFLKEDTRADITNKQALAEAFRVADPEIVFHLAAQPIVRLSYSDPLTTLTTNTMGTAHMLEAARSAGSLRAIVLITTDKVYENREWVHPYRENDQLGGRDPYSASKAAAEIIASSYRESFFSGDSGHPAFIATARAGNVIGGGDWACDRITPDCIRAFVNNQPVQLRFPSAVRPWQHVLEPLSGYLQLGAALGGPGGAGFAKAWNLGPDVTGDATVGHVAQTIARLWGDGARVECPPHTQHLHEANLLRLDSTLARTELGWHPRWTLQDALTHTTSWYKAWSRGCDMTAFTFEQISAYEAA